MNRVNAERVGGRDIRGHVVDIDGATRVDREPLDQHFENPWVRLDQLDVARDEDPVKPAQEFEALEGRRVGLRGKIGQAEQRRAALFQFGQDLDRAGNRSGHHLVEAGTVGIDQLSLVGMLRL